ncbi:hypothetical protein ACMGDM_11935 [Sphingomonas sp. DT-51]|uniref:hypothetical protein n=1 Tax=Sphingomonas sp. DT-51 TaxID=3396165 RepID=UPI003F1D59BD
MGLQLVLTDASRAAVIDHSGGGFRAVRVAAVGVSPSPVAASTAASALADEVKRIATIAGETTAPDTFHVTVTDESQDAYIVRSFALYLDDGTLFALYGQDEVIVEKSAQSLLLLALDVALVDVPAAAITFGSAAFTNPAATPRRAGVVRLASDEEAVAGVERAAAVTPGSMRLFAQLAGATFTGGVTALRGVFADDECYLRVPRAGLADVSFDAGDVLRYDRAADRWDFLIDSHPRLTITAAGLDRAGNRIWDAGNDGAGSGLDADLLDGHDAAAFALLTGATFTGGITAVGGLFADNDCYLRVPRTGIADLSFDAGDVLRYDRAADRLDFFVANTPG